MELPLNSVLLEPSQSNANFNALIAQLNNFVGMLAPQTGVGANGSDTTTDVLSTINLPAVGTAQTTALAGFDYLSTGQRINFSAQGVTGSNAHTKTIGFQLVFGTSTITYLGSAAANGQPWTASLDVVNYGSVGTPAQTIWGSISIGGTATQFSDTRALSLVAGASVSLVGSTNTAAASDVVCRFFGASLYK